MTPVREKLLLVLLLLTHAALVFFTSARDSITIDEIAHIPAGISHWRTGSFAYYRVNPPMPRMLAVLPILGLSPALDDTLLSKDHPGARLEWENGRRFADLNKDRIRQFTELARLSGIAWSLLGGLLIYAWSKALFGCQGAFISLCLWSFAPNVIAHAHLVTPDIPASAAGIASVMAFRRHLNQQRLMTAAAAGGILGVAILAKFTMLVLLLILLGLFIAGIILRPHSSSLLRACGLLVVVYAVALFVVNAFYGFQGTGTALADYPFVSNALAGPSEAGFYACGRNGNRFRGQVVGKLPILLPADMVRGIDEQQRDFESGLRSYMCGQWTNHGWWYYYVYAALVKVPVGTLLLAGLAVPLLLWRSRVSDWLTFECVCLLFPVLAITIFVSSQTGFSHHFRYMLPAAPFLFVSCGAVGSFLGRRTIVRGVGVMALLAGSVASSMSQYPHALSYFNEVAGGPWNGPAHLVNSNVDWGQDLYYLKQWLEDHPEAAADLKLAYFGMIDPRTAGIEFSLPARTSVLKQESVHGVRQTCPTPGYYAVSVNLLHGMSFEVFGPGGQRIMMGRDEFDYLRDAERVGSAGYSIYVFYLRRADIERYRERLAKLEVTRE